MTSPSAASVFVANGLVPLDYCLAYGLVTCVGAYAGKRGIGHLVRKHQCAALIVLLLGGLIAASMLAISATGALALRQQLGAGQLGPALRLRSPCG